MADSTTNLDTISTAQAQKEVTANALFDAGSPATVFGRRASACVLLTWAYYGGMVIIDGVPTQVANGTLTLTDDADNYIEFDDTLSEPAVIVTAASDWTPGLRRLYLVTTASGAATAWEDHRVFGQTRSIDVSVADAGGYFTATDVEGALQELGAATAVVQPWDAHAFYPGVPGDAAVMLRVPVARAVTLPVNLAGSYGTASAASTGTVAFDITKNGTTIGTATFTAAATATFTTAGGTAQTLAAGDVLGITCPATADATLADVGFVLAGTR